MKTASRIMNLPPYLFAEIDRKVEEKKATGADVISLGIGDPDQPTPLHIVDELAKQAHNAANHRYPSYYGLPAFRQAIAQWYRQRFHVDLDPDTEVLPLIGSKEGIAHIYWALVDPGDKVLVPDPAYPVYGLGAVLVGAQAVYMPLLSSDEFNPRFSDVDPRDAEDSVLMWLNFPNNPTSAVAGPGLLEDAAQFAKDNDIVLAYDNAYSEITFDGYVAPSILQVPGAKEVAVEFNSLSKTYNMTGWRIGWVAGNAEVIEALGRVKTNVDSGIFNAVQRAGIQALTGPQEGVMEMCRLYEGRRDKVMEVLVDIGLVAQKPRGAIYVWVEVPDGFTSESFATHLLDGAAVVVAPGSGYGPSGEGYFRISLSTPTDRLEEALARIRDAL